MKKILLKIGLGVLLLVGILLIFGKYLLDTPLFKIKAGLKITSAPEAKVFIDGIEVGKTPYNVENLKEGEYLIKLVAENNNWQGKVRLNMGTVSVVNRDLASNEASSSGEMIVLKKGMGAIITSNPAGAHVFVDNKDRGVTPLELNDLKSGEHTFVLTSPNFAERSIKATLPDGYTLMLQVDLKTADFAPMTVVTPVAEKITKALILDTPLGFVRVRENPTVSAKEIARLPIGAEVVIIESSSNWFKIKTDNGSIGYINSYYVKKLN